MPLSNQMILKKSWNLLGALLKQLARSAALRIYESYN